MSNRKLWNRIALVTLISCVFFWWIFMQYATDYNNANRPVPIQPKMDSVTHGWFVFNPRGGSKILDSLTK